MSIHRFVNCETALDVTHLVKAEKSTDDDNWPSNQTSDVRKDRTGNAEDNSNFIQLEVHANSVVESTNEVLNYSLDDVVLIDVDIDDVIKTAKSSELSVPQAVEA